MKFPLVRESLLKMVVMKYEQLFRCCLGVFESHGSLVTGQRLAVLLHFTDLEKFKMINTQWANQVSMRLPHPHSAHVHTHTHPTTKHTQLLSSSVGRKSRCKSTMLRVGYSRIRTHTSMASHHIDYTVHCVCPIVFVGLLSLGLPNSR